MNAPSIEHLDEVELRRGGQSRPRGRPLGGTAQENTSPRPSPAHQRAHRRNGRRRIPRHLVRPPTAQQQFLPDLHLDHGCEIIRPCTQRLRSWYVLSFDHKEHTETLRALHQIGDGQAGDLVKCN